MSTMPWETAYLDEQEQQTVATTLQSASLLQESKGCSHVGMFLAEHVIKSAEPASFMTTVTLGWVIGIQQPAVNFWIQLFGEALP